MNRPRVSEKELDALLQGWNTVPDPMGLRPQLAKDLQEARRELKLFCELAENESLTIQDYAREIEKKYGWDE